MLLSQHFFPLTIFVNWTNTLQGNHTLRRAEKLKLTSSNNLRDLTTTIVLGWFPWQGHTRSCYLFIFQWSLWRWRSIWNTTNYFRHFLNIQHNIYWRYVWVIPWQSRQKYCPLEPLHSTEQNFTSILIYDKEAEPADSFTNYFLKTEQ